MGTAGDKKYYQETREIDATWTETDTPLPLNRSQQWHKESFFKSIDMPFKYKKQHSVHQVDKEKKLFKADNFT